METTNCKKCGVLVYETDIPSKKNGFCWRCEVERLNAVEDAEESMRAANIQMVEEINHLKEEKAALEEENERLRHTAFETCHRMQLIVLYYGQPEVQAAVDAWLEPDEDGGSNWFNPPAGVDENLEKLEHFKDPLKKMVP